MALNLVQVGAGAGGSSTLANSCSVTMATGPLTAGNWVVGKIGFVSAGHGDNTDISSVSDGVNNYTTGQWLWSTAQNTLDILFYGRVVTGGQQTITVTFNGTIAEYAEVKAHEVSGGVRQVDTSSAQQVEPTSAPVSGNVTTTYNGEYCYGALNTYGGGPGSYFANSPFTLENNVFGPDSYYVQPAAGTIQTGFTFDTGSYNCHTFILTLAPALIVPVWAVTM